MNAEFKKAFSRIKPVCDIVMVCPSPESISAFIKQVCELKIEALQELQQYVLFPFITHLKSTEIEKKYELQCKLVDAMQVVLEKVKINSFEMCLKIETALMNLVFDYSKTGMIAEVPEELKHSVMKCLTVLMLNLDNAYRVKLLKTQVPLIAQAVFVSVHIAKLEKLRALRLAALNCLMAHTCCHRSMTTNYHITDKTVETLAVDMLSSILPGVLAALQDVAACSDNPGHAIIVKALEATHRILCITMQDKFVPSKTEGLTTKDFANMIIEKSKNKDNEVSNEENKFSKDIEKRSADWYTMAGEKLTVVTKSLIGLRAHEHHKVRKELAVFCARVLTECNVSMQRSIPMVLEVLISLSKDEYPEVSEYSSNAVNKYLANSSDESRNKVADRLCDNFFSTLNYLPRILNNIDISRKLSALNLIHGYIAVLSAQADGARRVTAALAQARLQSLCLALLEAAGLRHDACLLTHVANRDVTIPPPTNSPWCKLRNLDSIDCERRFQEICSLLGALECAELIVDRILEMFQEQMQAEAVYVMNWMGSSPNSSYHLVKRILDAYIVDEFWNLPLDVMDPGAADSQGDVFTPSDWIKESVPDLYEGAVETRYTDISYRAPRPGPARAPPGPARAPLQCASRAVAQRHLTLCCLLTEGVGRLALRLKGQFAPYLLKTLCLVLERVGSKYELLHLSGLKAINDIALACSHKSVAELIRCNADYFTNQITVRLKKAWNIESALQILSVVMEYSDSSILDCLYGIVENVLVQSCDKYHQKDLYAYLKVFLTFIECINKWFLPKNKEDNKENTSENMFHSVIDYVKNIEESERLLSKEEFEVENSKTAEEMYKEDLKKNEEDILDYDDTVAPEKPPLPQEIKVTITILKRCLNFISTRKRDDAILALQILNLGLRLLRPYEDELLPLVHLVWSPLVSKFEVEDPVLLRRALELLVTLAELSRDFIRTRCVKEVLPKVYDYLQKSSKASYLKDAGSAYRSSQGYQWQTSALCALPRLTVALGLEDELLEPALACGTLYLSNKQPKPLQALAVSFFKTILGYDDGAAWWHLRKFCANEEKLQPPELVDCIELAQIVGTPFETANKEYESNVKSIFFSTTE